MPVPPNRNNDILIAGGGIGGLAAALALALSGISSTVFEQAREFGEIGAGIQLAPNAFQALDSLGVRDGILNGAVFIDGLIMMDIVSDEVVANIPVKEDFRARFGNPYAVIHRRDLLDAFDDLEHSWRRADEPVEIVLAFELAIKPLARFDLLVEPERRVQENSNETPESTEKL